MREPCNIEDLTIQECENVIKSVRWQLKKMKGRRGFSTDGVLGTYYREIDELFNAVSQQWDKLNG